jgi:ribulose-phosphate 3-epimerase
MVEVISELFEKDWDKFVEKVTLAASYGKWIHVDIADGTMVEAETLTDFSKLSELKNQFPQLSFEAHLMVANPEKYVEPLADSGFDRIIAHVESNDPRRFLAAVKFEEVEVGLALDGATEIDQIEPYFEEVDFVEILSSEAGAPGQPFLPEAIEKVKLIRENHMDLPIEVSGGIGTENALSIRDAGATRLVTPVELVESITSLLS